MKRMVINYDTLEKFTSDGGQVMFDGEELAKFNDVGGKGFVTLTGLTGITFFPYTNYKVFLEQIDGVNVISLMKKGNESVDDPLVANFTETTYGAGTAIGTWNKADFPWVTKDLSLMMANNPEDAILLKVNGQIITQKSLASNEYIVASQSAFIPQLA